MWPFSKKEVKKEIIYDNTEYVDVFHYPDSHVKIPILTYVVKTTRGSKVTFDLNCDYETMKDAFFDGEHASNRRIKQIANVEKNKAKKFIEEYKCKNNID